MGSQACFAALRAGSQIDGVFNAVVGEREARVSDVETSTGCGNRFFGDTLARDVSGDPLGCWIPRGQSKRLIAGDSGFSGAIIGDNGLGFTEEITVCGGAR